MSNAAYLDVRRRHDFVILFDVSDGNPNGDPDAGNLPRVDPETMQGLVTDVCLKRKVRNWVALHHAGRPRFNIYVEHHGVLNDQHRKAYLHLGKEPAGPKQDRATVDEARKWMCDNFYDIRVFGAVMTTNVNCGQVRGPIQLTFARSVEPVVPLDLSITRVAVTRAEDARPDEEKEGKITEMGRKALVPYGLYIGYGFVNPHFASDTGMGSDDLAIFWEALTRMWDTDRSASRGMMACRGIYIFSHQNTLGNAPAHKLFERIRVTRVDGVKAPRSFGHYRVTVGDADLPEGITLNRLGE